MFSFLFTRSILAGLIFCALMVTGSLCYHWHVTRGIRADEARTQQFLEQIKRHQTETHVGHVAEHTSSEGPGAVEVSPMEKDVSQTTSENSGWRSFKTEAELEHPLDLFREETAELEDAPYGVSPFGFGAFPEVPSDYPDPTVWEFAETLYAISPARARDWELRERVCIKLWQQGKRATSVVMENGLVYPSYPNTVYVRWGESIDEKGNPVTYIDKLLAPGDMSQYSDYFDNDIIPPGINVIPYDEGGINPYTFLNLN